MSEERDKERRAEIELRLRRNTHAVLATGITNVVADSIVSIVPGLTDWIMGEMYRPESEAEAQLRKVEEWVTSDVVTTDHPFGAGYRECQRDLREKLGITNKPKTGI